MSRIASAQGDGFGDYQNFGDVTLSFAPQSGEVTQYVANWAGRGGGRVRFDQNGVHYLREYFASYRRALSSCA